MVTRYRAAINGRQLDELLPGIIIKNIYEDAPSYSIEATENVHYGSHVSMKRRTQKNVTITFEIHEADVLARQKAIDTIMGWCDSGNVLTLNTRIGKMLHVICTQYPAVNALRWTDEMTVTFTAFDVPYWQDVSVVEKSLSGSGTTYSASLNVKGTAITPVTCSIRNGGTAITGATVTARSEDGETSTIHIDGITLTSGKTLLISHSTEDLLQITIDGESVYNKLQSDSSDMLTMKPGAGTVTVTLASSGSISGVNAKCSTAARWL